MSTVELQVTTHFSFLRGVSSTDELFHRARELGLTALGITDRNSLAGIVRAHVAARESGVRLIVGCRLDLTNGCSVLVYPIDRPAYSRLCRLLSIGKGRAGKGACQLDWSDLVTYGDGLIVVLLPDEPDDALSQQLDRLKRDFPSRGYLALTLRRRPGDAARLACLAAIAENAGIPPVATGDVLYHVSERRILQDVVTCIREGCTIDAAGFRLERYADRHLKSPVEIARLFERYPEAVARSAEIAERCHFDLEHLKYQYPLEACIPGLTPQQALEKLTWEGAAWRYPEGVPEKVRAQLAEELTLIETMGYAAYFLTVQSIVKFARSKNILCQGRGSAANSAVCFVLGITSVDPAHSNLLFGRFINQERGEPPDIDVDFEHEQRETVIQWIYQTYGKDRAALTAVVTRYRARGAVRDVGKVMGLTEDVTGSLARLVSHWDQEGVSDADAEELGLNLDDRRLRLTLELSRALMGTPRHLSQHPGGFVLTQDRLDDLVPIEPAAMKDRQVIEWDKDDIDVLKFMKVDVLGLGMLGCLHRAFDLMSIHRGLDLTIATIPQEDKATYEMIQKADTIGVFQIESRAQMSMLPRLKPKEFYDLVIEVAIVRPGPIQGDMVHPYLRRRDGIEEPDFPNEKFREVLGKTLGVPLFQEQAMRVAIECADFTASEADGLRKSMATFKLTGSVKDYKEKLISGMVKNGYEEEFATKIFKQLEGFGSYGFPESHAASFALLVYASSWLKCHHPDVFCCAILNAQPMGFYAPAQLVRDARTHGVEVRPVSVNHSHWDCTLEPATGSFLAVRLGFRMVKGLSNQESADLVCARGEQPFSSVTELRDRAGITVSGLEKLADADGFHALGLSRRDALWAVKALRDTALPLFAAADTVCRRPEIIEPTFDLPKMAAGRQVVQDYRSTGLSLRPHPVSFLRDELRRSGITPCGKLPELADGKAVNIAGIVLIRQRPGTAKGVVFITIEDETGIANLVIWPTLLETQRRTVITSQMLACRGRVQKEGDVIHVVADRLTDLSDLFASVGDRDENGMLPIMEGAGHTGITVRSRDFR